MHPKWGSEGAPIFVREYGRLMAQPARASYGPKEALP